MVGLLFLLFLCSLPYFGWKIGRSFGGFLEKRINNTPPTKQTHTTTHVHYHSHRHITVIDPETKEKIFELSEQKEDY